jgi:phosphoserine phosphatase
MNLPALVAFDVDGTLLRGETICECIGRQIGKAAEMRAFERLTSRDEIAAARREMATWYRPYTRQALLDCLQTARLAPGARKGFAQLREAGVKTALVSITWSFAVEWLAKELGADFAVGTDWLDTGEVADFWPDDKAIWLEQLMRRLNIAREAVAVVGDSAGDPHAETRRARLLRRSRDAGPAAARSTLPRGQHRRPGRRDERPHHTAVTLTFVPAFTAFSVFASPSAFAQTLQGLASRVSLPSEIGVRPKPMAIAWPSGQ